MQFNEMKAPMALPLRREFIKKLTEAEAGPTYTILFQNHLNDLVIRRVSLDVPVYRLGNGRTLASQQEYIARNHKQEDFFQRDPESLDALLAQHELLRNMLDDNELLEYFRQNEQNEPLILTQEAYVVNGNRRLCAMRTLLTEDPTKFKRFEYVRVVILPVCTETDIDLLEAHIQIQPDIKAKYSWVDTAMLLRDRQHAHGWSYAELARVHGVPESEVRKLINLLDDADQYLNHRGLARQYSKVVGLQFGLQKLQEGRKKCDSEAARDAFTQLAYIELDKPDQAGTRLYEAIPSLQKNLKEVVKTINEQISTLESSPYQESDDSNEGSGLSLLGSDGLSNDESSDASQTRLAHTARLAQDNTHHEQIRGIIQDVLEASKLQNRAKKSADSAVKLVAAAHTNLMQAYQQLSSDSNLSGLEAQLCNIESFVSKIRSWVNDNATDNNN